MPKTYLASSVLLVASAFAFWGCGKASTNPMNSPQSATAEKHSHEGHEHGDHAEGGNAEIVAALAKLPAEDRALAEQQKLCPVSGEPLGAMGAPIKVDVKGQPVFICCEGCKEDLLAKPDEYLAKVKK